MPESQLYDQMMLQVPSTKARSRAKHKNQRVDLRRDVWTLLFEFYDAERPQMSARCQEFGLTPQQGLVLRLIKPGSGSAMNEIANDFGCDASNITGIVNRLEARGFVKRTQPEHDRRVKMIELTKSGDAFRDKFLDRAYEPSAAIGSLSQEQLRAMRDLLVQIQASRQASGSQTAA